MPYFRVFANVALALTLLVMGALILAIDSAPLVSPNQSGFQSDAETARSILRNSVQNPLRQQQLKHVTLSEHDLTVIANFVLSRKHWQGYTIVRIHEQRLELFSSIKIPAQIANLYLNLKVTADDEEPWAQVREFMIGQLELPQPLVRLATKIFQALTPIGRLSQLAEPLVDQVRIQEGNLKITLNWSPEALSRAQDIASDLAMKERMLAYHNRLAETIERLGVRRYVSLGSLTQALFTFARTRSEEPGGLPVEENRAAVIVLGAYANGRDLTKELSAVGDPALLAKRGVLLNRRIDTAQHFTASAALAISGHRTLADLVGLAKEINDIRHGSGFSFTDLAADRAGTLFGKAAVKSDESARELQATLSENSDESVFMPSLKGLPENLGPDEFTRQFHDIESPEFQALKREIEERILACPLYQ